MQILMVLNKSYHEDPRAQREISALSQAGHFVRVLCFSDPSLSPPRIQNVVFFQCTLKRRRSCRFRYVFEYITYLLWSSVVSLWQLARRRYDVLEVFLFPEPLVLVGLIPKLAGVRVLSDWMDLGCELYDTKYSVSSYDPLRFLIRISERVVVAISDSIIFPNRAFLEALSSRGIRVPRYRFVMNAADLEVFSFQHPQMRKAKATHLLFTGTISERNGVRVLLEAFAEVERKVSDCILTVLGNSIDLSTTKLCKKAYRNARVHFTGRVSLSEVAACLRAADIGLIPTCETPFTRCNVPTRLFEFGAASMPVICADLPGIRQYFDDRHVVFYKPGDCTDLARRILRLIGDYELRQSLGQSLQARCMELAWKRSRQTYLDLLESLASGWHSWTCAQQERASAKGECMEPLPSEPDAVQATFNRAMKTHQRVLAEGPDL
jgi:glycosyltransferase involved in cell wall biosynthesis